MTGGASAGAFVSTTIFCTSCFTGSGGGGEATGGDGVDFAVTFALFVVFSFFPTFSFSFPAAAAFVDAVRFVTSTSSASTFFGRPRFLGGSTADIEWGSVERVACSVEPKGLRIGNCEASKRVEKCFRVIAAGWLVGMAGRNY